MEEPPSLGLIWWIRLRDQFNLVCHPDFHLEFEIFSKKVSFYDTYPAAPGPWIHIRDLRLWIQEIVSCHLQSFWNQQYCGQSCKKVTQRCTVCPWVLMASTAVESFLFRSWPSLFSGVMGWTAAPLLLLFKQGLWHLILQSCSCSYGFQVEFFAGEYSTSWWEYSIYSCRC